MAYLYILTILAIISVIDIKKYIIPDSLVLAVCLAALWEGAHIKAAAVSLLIYMLFCLPFVILGRELPLGMGDAKLFAAIAFSYGGYAAFTSFAVASIASGLFAAIKLSLKRANKKDRIAFGPFIFLGFIYFSSFSLSIFAM